MSADARRGSTDPDAGQAGQAPMRTTMGWTGRVAVPQDHVGIVRRRFGAADPDFPRITPDDNYRGWQARTLPPGQTTWLKPGQYSVELVPRVYVPEDKIGLVTANEGRQRPRGRRLGRYVECRNFQDGQAFLLGGGEQGRQAATLAGGHYYHINTRLFGVELVPRTHVPAGTVGLVIALDGKVVPPGQRFARHVECDNFQDGQAFLEAGGEQGRQLAVLGGGVSYDINPALFKVLTTETIARTGTQDGLTAAHLREFTIPSAMTGVVLTLDGAAPGEAGTVGPRVEGHQSFRLPWVFLDGGGRKGVQQESLGEGSTCALNPWFARVVLIPTHVLNLEWSRSPDQKAGNYDSQLSRITVTVQGYKVHMELSQTLKIPERAAPRLVGEFGDQMGSAPLGGLVDHRAPVQRFVEKVLGATVKGYINGMAASGSVQEFLGRYHDARRELADKVRAELAAWGVEPGSTSLGSFEAEDAKLNEELQEAASEEARRNALAIKEQNAKIQARITMTLMESKLMEAHPEFWSEVKALGADNVTLIRAMEAASGMNVPQIINSKSSDLKEVLPLHILRDLVSRMREQRPMPDSAQEPDAGEISGT